MNAIPEHVSEEAQQLARGWSRMVDRIELVVQNPYGRKTFNTSVIVHTFWDSR